MIEKTSWCAVAASPAPRTEPCCISRACNFEVTRESLCKSGMALRRGHKTCPIQTWPKTRMDLFLEHKTKLLRTSRNAGVIKGGGGHQGSVVARGPEVWVVEPVRRPQVGCSWRYQIPGHIIGVHLNHWPWCPGARMRTSHTVSTPGKEPVYTLGKP